MQRWSLSVFPAVSALLSLSACGDGKREHLFPPQVECEGEPIVALMGQHQMVISALEIGRAEDGFDLDGDGEPDNKLAAVGSLARSAIEDAFDDNDIVIPIEFFDFADPGPDECVKFAIYAGDWSHECEDEEPVPEDCNPYSSTYPIPLDPLSFDAGGSPLVQFTAGTVVDEAGTLRLEAGPSIFSVNVPIDSRLSLELRVTGATIVGDLVMSPAGWRLVNGKLGGVLDANTMDKVRGLDVEEINLTPENSLLDAVFANILGVILALPRLPAGHPYEGCHTPDIDVDQDGLEAFCASDPDVPVVDVCIDGDGTVVFDEVDGAGNILKDCTEAVDSEGNLRFVDGISVVFKFETVPAELSDTLAR